MAEGLKLCLELARRLTVQKVFFTEKALAACPEIQSLGGTHYAVTQPVAEKLAQTQATQGLYVLFALPSAGLDALRAGGRYVVLEQVQDPSNVGAVLRSAAAFGFDGAVLTQGAADAFSAKAVRASMGAVAHIDIVQDVTLADALAACKAQELGVYAAALRRACPLGDAAPPANGLALLIGNEGAGLTEEAVDAADIVVRIPMTDKVESLNAAAAASVLLWHFRGV